MFPLETTNVLLALGTVALQVASASLLALILFRKTGGITTHVREWGLWVGFALTLVATVLTLYYSEVLGIPPCPLCWWQRVFLYPQVALFAFALWKRERSIADYSIVLSVIGLGFSLYHHALQVLPSGSLPCPAEGVSCAQRFMFEFGYITYPLMAASLFTFLIILMLFVRKRD